MINVARTNTMANVLPRAEKKSAKSKPVVLSKNQLMALAVAFGLASFTIVLLAAVWTYVIAHGA